MISHITSIQVPLGTFAWIRDDSRLLVSVMVKCYSIWELNIQILKTDKGGEYYNLLFLRNGNCP